MEKIVIERNSQAGNIAVYLAMFENFMNKSIKAHGQTDPEITGPMLAAYNVGPYPCIMSAMVTAFVAGVNAGMDLCQGENSNLTKIE